MKIGMVTDSVARMSLDEMLDYCAELGLDAIEPCVGNWGAAAHIGDMDALRYQRQDVAVPYWQKLAGFAQQYDFGGGVMSIKHEDQNMSCNEGVRRSVNLLRRIVPEEKPDYVLSD